MGFLYIGVCHLQPGTILLLLSNFKPYMSFSFFFFLRQSCVVIQAKVQWYDPGSGNLCLLGSSNSPASPSQVSCHRTQLIFVFLVKIEFHYIGQAGLELLTSADPPASASQSARITAMSHGTQGQHMSF